MRVIGDGMHSVVVQELIGLLPMIEGCAIAIGNCDFRKRAHEANAGELFPVLIHPSAVVSPTARLGDGTVVLAGAIVGAQAVLGKFCLVNTGAQIDHHCVVGDYAHIAPGAVLCGCVEVGEGAWVGAGAVCVQGAKVDPWALVKAGTVHKSEEWSERCQRLAGNR